MALSAFRKTGGKVVLKRVWVTLLILLALVLSLIIYVVLNRETRATFCHPQYGCWTLPWRQAD